MTTTLESEVGLCDDVESIAVPLFHRATMKTKSLITATIVDQCKDLFAELASLPEPQRIEAINQIRLELHKHSPMANEPVDCVLWVPLEQVHANDYNPNSVAPPEMKLLAHSITEDGYTQPIVTWQNETIFEVIDGYHRNRVGREVPEVRERVRGYLPVTVVNAIRTDRGDRIAATIRHNRARGKHRIDSMSEIVVELKRRNWSDEKIGRELGMDPDEVLRLTQITGLAEMFADRDFSKAWEAQEAAEINEGDNLAINEENLSALPEMGGLAGGDVPRNPVQPPPVRNRRGGKVAKNADAAQASDAPRDGGVADSNASEPDQQAEKPASVAGAGGLFPDDDNPGLPHETGVVESKRKPAGRSKRISRQRD